MKLPPNIAFFGHSALQVQLVKFTGRLSNTDFNILLVHNEPVVALSYSVRLYNLRVLSLHWESYKISN